MSEITQPIPARLRNVAVNGHVAGAADIIDDNLNKTQAVINAEIDEVLGDGGNVAFIDDDDPGQAVVPSFDPESQSVHITSQVLSEQQKAQVRTNIGLNDVDARISNAVASEASQRQAQVNGVESEMNTKFQQYDTAIGALNGSDTVVGALPQSGETNKIYRVPDDPTTNKYTDYGWNGTQFVKLATYPNDVDDEPTAGSDNLVKSGGVYGELYGRAQRTQETETSGGRTIIVNKNISAGDTLKLTLKSGTTPLSVSVYKGTEAVAANFLTTLTTIDSEESFDIDSNYSGLYFYNSSNPGTYSVMVDLLHPVSEGIISELQEQIDSLETQIDDTAGELENVKEELFGTSGQETITETSTGRLIVFHVNLKTGQTATITLQSASGESPMVSIAKGTTAGTDIGIITQVGGSVVYTATESVDNINTYRSDANAAYTISVVINRNADGEIDRLKKGVWDGKKIALYGDSITALCGSDTMTAGTWGKFLQDSLGANIIGRGIGGSTIAHQGTSEPIVIDGVTLNHRGFCDWDRIVAQFPASIKDTIDAVIVMGGTNDVPYYELGDCDITEYNTKPSDLRYFDEAWFDSPYYLGGDYDIMKGKGALCSTIMKLQTWMPQAVIIVATPLSGENGQHPDGSRGFEEPVYSTGLTLRDFSLGLIDAAHRMSVPVIDLNGECGINQLNRNLYIKDAAHPYVKTDGAGVSHNNGNVAIARVMIQHMKHDIMPKFDWIPWRD